MSVNKNIAPLRHACKHQQVQQHYRLRRLPSANWLVTALPLKWTGIKKQVSHTITYGENMVAIPLQDKRSKREPMPLVIST